MPVATIALCARTNDTHDWPAHRTQSPSQRRISRQFHRPGRARCVPDASARSGKSRSTTDSASLRLPAETRGRRPAVWPISPIPKPCVAGSIPAGGTDTISLRTLKLSGMLETLNARLTQAQAGQLGHLDFLQVLCQDEIARRQAMSMTRRLRRAHFDQQATLEGFDFAASPKLPTAQIRDLAALRCSTVENRSCCTARSVSARPTSPKHWVTSPSAKAPKSASTRPAVSWPRVEPERHRGVAQVVRVPGQRRGDLNRGQPKASSRSDGARSRS